MGHLVGAFAAFFAIIAIKREERRRANPKRANRQRYIRL
jgi:hypothetical protein